MNPLAKKCAASDKIVEAFELMIPHYQKCIDELPKHNERRDDFLFRYAVSHGLCLCSRKNFKIDINFEMSEIRFGFFIGPTYDGGYVFAKQTLQWRLDLMRETIKIREGVTV